MNSVSFKCDILSSVAVRVFYSTRYSVQYCTHMRENGGRRDAADGDIHAMGQCVTALLSPFRKGKGREE